MTVIDREARLPLYQQLYEILHRRVLLKDWKPGDRLPTENELVQEYGVSRITARTVLEMLVREGLIYRQAGRGTSVAHRTLEQGLSQIIAGSLKTQNHVLACLRAGMDIATMQPEHKEIAL